MAKSFLFLTLDALHVDRARSFVGILSFERDFLVDTELIEGNSDEGGRVEEDIFLSIFWSDEAKSFVRKTLDGTHHRFEALV